MIVRCAKNMCFVRSIYLHVSAVFITNRRVWDGVKHRNEKEHLGSQNPLGEKTNLKHTPSYLVRVRKYSRK